MAGFTLENTPLFHDVPPNAVTMILEGSTELSYHPGDTLVYQDAAGQALYLLTAGVVRVTRQSLGGRVRVLGDLYAPAVLGETALLLSTYRSASVSALTDVQAAGDLPRGSGTCREPLPEGAVESGAAAGRARDTAQ